MTSHKETQSAIEKLLAKGTSLKDIVSMLGTSYATIKKVKDSIGEVIKTKPVKDKVKLEKAPSGIPMSDIKKLIQLDTDLSKYIKEFKLKYDKNDGYIRGLLRGNFGK